MDAFCKELLWDFRQRESSIQSHAGRMHYGGGYVLMPRAQSDEQLALAGLRQAVKDGRRGAANDLARYLARRDRANTPTPTELRAQERDAQKERQSTSRSKSVVGPQLTKGMQERTLDWLALTDEEQAKDPEEGAAVLAAHEAWRRELDAWDWKTYRANTTPRERHAQQEMDAAQRAVQEWFRQHEHDREDA